MRLSQLRRLVDGAVICSALAIILPLELLPGDLPWPVDAVLRILIAGFVAGLIVKATPAASLFIGVTGAIIHSTVGFVVGSVAMIVFAATALSAPPQVAPKPPPFDALGFVAGVARSFALDAVIAVPAVAIGGRVGRAWRRISSAPVTTRRFYR